MTSLAALWLPILVSAAFVFVLSSIIHMVLPVHRSDYKKLPDEDKIGESIRKANVQPGSYMIPCSSSMKELETPEMQAKFATGPVGTMILQPNGMPHMPKLLAQWFGFCLVVSVFCAYLAAIQLRPGAGSITVFQMTGAVATLGYAFSHAHEWIWKRLPTCIMVKFFIDGVIYALATAATFAWLWPAAA